MITKFKLFENENIVEIYSLNDIGCSFSYDEYFDTNGFEKKLKKLFLNNLCEFEQFQTKNKIKGLVVKIEVITQFDHYFSILFVIKNKNEEIMSIFEVDPSSTVITYLKEPRKIKEYDKDLDPYGEEEWED